MQDSLNLLIFSIIKATCQTSLKAPLSPSKKDHIQYLLKNRYRCNVSDLFNVQCSTAELRDNASLHNRRYVSSGLRGPGHIIMNHCALLWNRQWTDKYALNPFFFLNTFSKHIKSKSCPEFIKYHFHFIIISILTIAEGLLRVNMTFRVK